MGNSQQNLGFSSQNLRIDFGGFVTNLVNEFKSSENFENVDLTNKYQAEHRREIRVLIFGEDQWKKNNIIFVYKGLYEYLQLILSLLCIFLLVIKYFGGRRNPKRGWTRNFLNKSLCSSSLYLFLNKIKIFFSLVLSDLSQKDLIFRLNFSPCSTTNESTQMVRTMAYKPQHIGKYAKEEMRWCSINVNSSHEHCQNCIWFCRKREHTTFSKCCWSCRPKMVHSMAYKWAMLLIKMDCGKLSATKILSRCYWLEMVFGLLNVSVSAVQRCKS